MGNKVITYDYNNRPTSVQFGGQTTTYTYGADSARQTKTVGSTQIFYAGMAEIRKFGTAQETIILHPDFHASEASRAVHYLSTGRLGWPKCGVLSVSRQGKPRPLRQKN